MSRYAQNTSVPMDRSRAEAEKTLIRYGANGFAYAWEQREEPYPHPKDCPACKGTRLEPGAQVYDDRSRHAVRCRRFPYNAPNTITREVILIGFKMGTRQVRLEVPMPHETETGTRSRAEAATRQRWRALVLVLKAKLEAVASGISTLDQEFLANVVMEDGRTIGQALVPRLSEAVSSGRLLGPAASSAAGG